MNKKSHHKRIVASHGAISNVQKEIGASSQLIEIFKNPWMVLLLYVVIGFLIYGNSLNGAFIWDDNLLILENNQIKDWKNFKNIFSENIGRESGKTFEFYRPLQLLTYAWDFALWKFNVVGYHLTNTLLHIAAAILLFFLINKIIQNYAVSILTGLLFLVHPIHTEAVSYISGRADPLALVFILMSFLFYLKYLNDSKAVNFAVMTMSAAAALLSRENSLILPFLIATYHYVFKVRIAKFAFATVLTLTLTYIAVRLTLLKSLLPETLIETSLTERIPGFFVNYKSGLP